MKLTRARLLGISIGTTLVVALAPVVFLAAKGIDVNGREGRAVAMFQFFAPLVGALVGEALLRRDEVAQGLGLVFAPNRLWFVAWTLPLLIAAVGIVTTWVFGVAPILTLPELVRAKRAMVPPEALAAFDAAPPTQAPAMLLAMAIPGSILNLFPALAAEVGLRGFLYREMPGGYFARALRIGLVHFAILAPLVALGWGSDEGPLVALPLLLVHTALVALVALYLRARTGSVYGVALFTATSLAVSRPAIDLTLGAPTWLRPMDGLAGVVGLAFAFGLCLAHDRFVAPQKLIRAPTKPAS